MNETISRTQALTQALILGITADWGYTEWQPRNVGDGYALFCHGSEWIDGHGENLIFSTEQEALEYMETRMPA
jgi:hypothetical protein